jgi:hypothetical protein
MESSDQESSSAALSLAVAAQHGDDEAVRLILEAYGAPEVALGAGQVIWWLAKALGQKLEPARGPLEVIQAASHAMRDPEPDD